MGLWAVVLWLVAVAAIAVFFLVPKARVWVVVAVVATSVLGVASYKMRRDDVHLTACGFDSQGAYAKVRVDNWLGLSARQRLVDVSFSFRGGQPVDENGYGGAGRSLAVPALGHVTAVLHGPFPPQASPGHPVSQDDTVQGRTVYRYSAHGHQRLVTKRFAVRHPGATQVETVPTDPRALQCDVSAQETSGED